MPYKMLVFVMTLGVSAGCSSVLLSSEKLLSKTAEVLNISRDSLKLVARMTETGFTTYIVETKNRG